MSITCKLNKMQNKPSTEHLNFHKAKQNHKISVNNVIVIQGNYIDYMANKSKTTKRKDTVSSWFLISSFCMLFLIVLTILHFIHLYQLTNLLDHRAISLAFKTFTIQNKVVNCTQTANTKSSNMLIFWIDFYQF